MLLGLDPGGTTITGLFVLEQKETPGLGNNISTPQWRRQFNGKSTDRPLTVVKGGARGASQAGHTIDAITGATISSRSVTAIVNNIIANVRGRLLPENIRFAGGK